jgi:DNA-binding NarL/FixJ family response regulator
MEVLKMVARGESNKEIAYSLSISVKTVEAHKAHALEKLELHNRAGIIQYALLHGWLDE